MAMDNKRIVRVNVEVVYDDGTLDEFKELRGDQVVKWADMGGRATLRFLDSTTRVEDAVTLERK